MDYKKIVPISEVIPLITVIFVLVTMSKGKAGVRVIVYTPAGKPINRKSPVSETLVEYESAEVAVT
jgi:hypothetical protein